MLPSQLNCQHLRGLSPGHMPAVSGTGWRAGEAAGGKGAARPGYAVLGTVQIVFRLIEFPRGTADNCGPCSSVDDSRPHLARSGYFT